VKSSKRVEGSKNFELFYGNELLGRDIEL